MSCRSSFSEPAREELLRPRERDEKEIETLQVGKTCMHVNSTTQPKGRPGTDCVATADGRNTQTTTKKSVLFLRKVCSLLLYAITFCSILFLVALDGVFFYFCLFCNFGIFVLLISAHFPQHRFVFQTLMLNECTTYVPAEMGSTSDLCEVRCTKKQSAAMANKLSNLLLPALEEEHDEVILHGQV